MREKFEKQVLQLFRGEEDEVDDGIPKSPRALKPHVKEQQAGGAAAEATPAGDQAAVAVGSPKRKGKVDMFASSTAPQMASPRGSPR